jgi:CheY-like chemotaxis protein
MLMAKILIIEDDKSMNEVLAETLEDEGHDVQSAFSGKHALSLAEQNVFDLAVSDVRLPGIDGVETLAKLKQVNPNLKCIVITGYASADTPIRAIRLKVDDYLFKPFSLDYFLTSVERSLALETRKESRFNRIKNAFSIFERYKDNALVDLVAERQEAFRGMYLGTRSGYLQKKAASEVYSKLEVLEDRFRAILNAPTTDSKAARELQASYTDLSNRIASLELGASADEEHGAIPVEQMSALYEAIRSSQIGLDDLQYAPLLRKTPDNRFETLQELLELKRQLWPNLS